MIRRDWLAAMASAVAPTLFLPRAVDRFRWKSRPAPPTSPPPETILTFVDEQAPAGFVVVRDGPRLVSIAPLTDRGDGRYAANLVAPAGCTIEARVGATVQGILDRFGLTELPAPCKPGWSADLVDLDGTVRDNHYQIGLTRTPALAVDREFWEKKVAERTWRPAATIDCRDLKQGTVVNLRASFGSLSS